MDSDNSVSLGADDIESCVTKVLEDHVTAESSEESSSPKKKIKLTSKISEYFDVKTTDKKNDKVGECKICKEKGVKKAIKMTNCNTSGLKRHIVSKHPTFIKEESQSTSSLNTEDRSNTSRDRKIDDYLSLGDKPPRMQDSCNKFEKGAFNNLLVKMAVTKYLPFNFYEDKSVADSYKYLKKDISLPGRNSLRSNIMHTFQNIQDKVKRTLISNKSKISFTIDGWSSIANRSFYGITAHFITDHYKLESIVLDFVPSKGKHSGNDIAQIFYNVVKLYGIERKIVGITTDNASANFSFTRELHELIPSFDPIENHFCCFAHILNLGAQDFMQLLKCRYNAEENDESEGDDDQDGNLPDNEEHEDIAEQEFAENSGMLRLLRDDNENESSDVEDEGFSSDFPVTGIRILVKKIKISEQVKNKFILCCQAVNLEYRRPILDVCTRWNSTFDMLSWACNYKAALNLLCENYPKLKKFRVPESCWEFLSEVLKFLKPLATLTNMLCGDKYCAISNVVIGINVILDKLEQWAKALDDKEDRSLNDENLILALNAARNKIVGHYNKTNWIYCVCLILDPRQKKSVFERTEWGKHLEQESLKTFEKLYKECYYELNLQAQPQSNKKNTLNDKDPTNQQGGTKDEFDLEFESLFLKEGNDHDQAKAFSEPWRKELDEYLESPRVEKGVDILDWWWRNENRYPNLSKMARDYLSVMATSASSERLFSKAALIIRKHRNRLNDDAARGQLCLNSWMDNDLFRI